MYKLFTKIITTRLEKKLDENQPREQAGFRSKYSTADHIHAINQLKEKCREYNRKEGRKEHHFIYLTKRQCTIHI